MLRKVYTEIVGDGLRVRRENDRARRSYYFWIAGCVLFCACVGNSVFLQRGVDHAMGGWCVYGVFDCAGSYTAERRPTCAPQSSGACDLLACMVVSQLVSIWSVFSSTVLER